MKSISRIFGAVAVLLAAMSANAQRSAQFTVPFAFGAAGHTLPAGDYRVSRNAGNGVLTLSGYGLPSVNVFSTVGDQIDNHESFLRFYNYGDKWLLHDVAMEGTAYGVPAVNAEEKLMAGRKAIRKNAGM